MIKVLIVDDDFMVATIHTRFVEAMPGFDVVGQAHSGLDALRRVHELEPDLILLDIYLPDIPGTEVIRRLREDAVEVDVLVITAADDEATIRAALRGGVWNYLLKPFDELALRKRLNGYAERKRLMTDVSIVPQQHDIDRVFGGGSIQDQRTPKNVAPETVALIEDILSKAPGGLSATEAADASGLSRVSARRYLQYLESIGRASVTLRYAVAGRPERRFRYTGTPRSDN